MGSRPPPRALPPPPQSRSTGDLEMERKAYYSFTKGIEWHMPPRQPYKASAPLRPWEEYSYHQSPSLQQHLAGSAEEQQEDSESEDDED
mmetsp:Transcript_27332/g.86495  ORF Transcript_27332/g.86495 Transcript_27332/m.86495 type:complete len:89 (+) Transcript_27332:3-269(+)